MLCYSQECEILLVSREFLENDFGNSTKAASCLMVLGSASFAEGILTSCAYSRSHVQLSCIAAYKKVCMDERAGLTIEISHTATRV